MTAMPNFALAATHHALKDAGLSRDDLVPDRTGVIVGSGIGGMETIEKQMTALIERGPRRVSPFMIPSLIANIAGGSLPSIWVQTARIIPRECLCFRFSCDWRSL